MKTYRETAPNRVKKLNGETKHRRIPNSIGTPLKMAPSAGIIQTPSGTQSDFLDPRLE